MDLFAQAVRAFRDSVLQTAQSLRDKNRDQKYNIEVVGGYFTYINKKLNGFYQRINEKTGKTIFKGNLMNGLLNGYGEYYHEDGEIKCIGEFKDNILHGYGIEYLKSIIETEEKYLRPKYYIYRGENIYGMPHGHGYLFSVNKGVSIYDGEFRYGNFNNGNALVMDDDILIYDGEFVDGSPLEEESELELK